ncbi:MAG: SDR family NAD(P)-dependent oxidoreductase [Cyanobacteria bacterium P01_F01_bin.150]
MEKEFVIHADHPIVTNHKAYGQELLPGLAYIDILYQFFREHGYNFATLELRNLSIYRPLFVGENGSLKLLLRADEISEDQWSVHLYDGDRRDEQAPHQGQLYIKAEMYRRRAAPIFTETLDISALYAASQYPVSLDDIYAQCCSQGLIHSGMMKAKGMVYKLDHVQVVEVCLPAAAQAESAHFMFHPTLIDGGSVGSSNLFATLVDDEQRLFLPLFYGPFCASSLLGQRCFVRVETASVRRKNDMMFMDVEFFDESGQKVAELKNFVNKLVREAAFINPHLKRSDQDQSSTQSLASDLSKGDHSQEATDLSQIDKSAVLESMEERLQEVFASRLDCAPDQIETDAGYYELGMDSPMLLDIVVTLENTFSTKLVPTLLFEYTTIEELAAHLIDENLSFENGSVGVEQPRHVSNVGVPDFVAQRTAEEKEGRPLSINSIRANFKAQVENEGDIAIIGLAGRYPEANNINEFWQNLTLGKDCIREIPEERWDWRSIAKHKSPSGKSISKWGGFIQDPDCFDHQFFKVSPREAEILDPQERLFVQTCWECIEDAGYTPETLAVRSPDPHRQHSVGVFAGVMHKDYAFLGAEAIARGEQFHLSINNAPIANRVSYFCDFHGPSIVIDTVCSSSLTAVHLAIESIRSGESEVALAGGVNLSVHPSKYMLYGSLDMYASDGRCRTFGSGGDGYVSGEGVGAVLLKPLAQAISDRDHIYAVIKGSTINHVGKVTGISVPNAAAQGDMILQCLEKTGIDPRTIGYVEAHGTGTPLGDPIEIKGLNKAFREYTADTQYCAIGSVKSNIGHTESAAGISGLSKVALQLHHQTLVPSLHSKEINPLLNLDTSPFYVQHKTEHWESSSQYPRRAGLSAFGATGSNAHVILEEYINAPTDAGLEWGAKDKDQIPVLIPLSAKNGDRLKEAAQNLYHFLRSTLEAEKAPQLCDIAYTLQVGRRSMESRLILLVNSKRQLLQTLKDFLDGNTVGENRWVKEQVKPQKRSRQGEDRETMLRQWGNEGRLDQIAQAWTQGVPIDWESLCPLLYPSTAPARISLPTYPFAKVRHWVPMEMKTVAPVAALHPLLHRNTSVLGQQRFSSTFSGAEFFLADHQVQGQKILPGVAYLEMARAAVIQATSLDDSSVIKLKNIIWQHPLVIGDQPVDDQPVDDQVVTDPKRIVSIDLVAQKDTQIRFDVHTGHGLEANQYGSIIHCQGIAIWENTISKIAVSAGREPEIVLDLDDLQEKICQHHFSPEQCYQTFQEMGIEYGEAHRGISAVYVGNNQLLAELTLPDSLWNRHEQFVLHPSLLDSALQAAIGFRLAAQASDGEPQTSLPYALEFLEIRAKCSPSMWVWIRYANNNKANSEIQKFDLDLCDSSGRVCVLMRGFSSRVFGPRDMTSQDMTYQALQTATTQALQTTPQTAQQHPLLHQPISPEEPGTYQFVSRFTGNEFFLRDHQQVMLGMAYLEMAHRAGISAGKTILGLKNVIWSQLLYIAGDAAGDAVGDAQDVSIQLYQDGHQYRFKITTQDQATQRNIHCQGKLVTDPASYPEIPDRLNIEEIQSRCPSTIVTADCDRLLQSTHGSSLLTITQLWHGDNEALALLQLPEGMRSQRAAYILHPSMINGAILSSIVFSLLKQPQDQLPMPFALEKLWIYGEIPERVYAYVSVISPNKHDIELVDENGEPIVSLKGFTASIQGALQGHASHAGHADRTVTPHRTADKNGMANNVLYGRTSWQDNPLSAGNNPDATASLQMAAPIFFLGQDDPELKGELWQRWPSASIDILRLDNGNPADIVQANFLQIFQRIKALIKAKPQHRQPIVLLVPQDDQAYLYTGYAALLKTAGFENAKIVGKVIRYPIDNRIKNFAERIAQDIYQAPQMVDVSYTQTGVRQTKQLLEIVNFNTAIHNTSLNHKLGLQNGDVVLITGGLGGLGQLFAKHLSQVTGLTLVLSGRSPLTPAKADALHQLQQAEANVSYLRCDVSDKNAVIDLIQTIHNQYGKLNGIIHSAGLNLDSYIFNKTTEEIIKVMQPKISGVLALDQACQEIHLNFMVLFSSIAGVFGSIGQADYATANAFLDSFAEARNLRIQQGKCFGKTLSINWPLWKDGGMGVSAQDEVLMEQNTGMIPLETDAGLNAFELALPSEFSQILVTQGNVERIRSRLLPSQPVVTSQPTTAELHQTSVTQTTPPEQDHQESQNNQQNIHQQNIHQQSNDSQHQQAWLMRALHKDLAASLCRLQKVKPDEVDIDAEFSNYGFDSIGFTTFANILNDMYGLELMPTLFFECSNLRSLAHSLLENHSSALLTKYKPPRQPSPSTPKPAPSVKPVQPQDQIEQDQIETVPSVQHQPVQAQQATQESHPSSPAQISQPISQPQAKDKTESTVTPIAIIGMSGKFPGSDNLTEFWHHLEANHDLISEIPEDRWNWRDYYGDPHNGNGKTGNGKTGNGKTKAKWGGFIKDIDRFDPLFFGISPLEAELMDPQFRLFLETVWATIEDAGYKASTLSGSKTGLYVGVTTTDYKDLMQQAWVKENSQDYLAMFPFMLANRVSYLLNFRGPSEAIDTACSSSLVAIHRAIESIRQGSCDMAIAGGVNIIANPQLVIAATQGGMLSEDGRCKTFDKSANGYVRGEGVGAILLKPLDKAIADNDPIHGIIRGSAENHGGKATSPTAPNPVAQQELLVSAYTQAGITPDTVSYIEAHGTGTPLGDPIEINGLKAAFSQLYEQAGRTFRDQPHCALGSVKTNIGHLEAAAGISGVLKVLMMMKHQKIPGNRHLKEPNPYLKLANSPFYLVRETQDWLLSKDESQTPIPRRAGVSSFGIGGTNVHLVLEEYTAQSVTESIDSDNISCIVLSAKTRESLTDGAKNLHRFLAAHRTSSSQVPLRLCDIAYTLQVGREEMDYRLGFTAASIDDLEEKLDCFINAKQDHQNLYEGCIKQRKDSLDIFDSEDDLQEVLTRWIKTQKYGQILKLWVNGLSVNWGQLYGEHWPQRISLPSYPFARERYWIPTSDPSASSVSSVPTPAPHSVADANSLGSTNASNGVLMCCPIWQEKTAPMQARSETLIESYSQHLILYCGINAPAELPSQLGTNTTGHTLQRQAEDLAQDYQFFCEQTFTHLQDILNRKPTGKVLVQIVIPGLEAGEQGSGGAGEQGSRGAGEQGSGGAGEEENANCLLHGLAALLKTAHLEYPQIMGQLIEVDPQHTDDELVQCIYESSQLPEDIQVRYRQGRREVLSWQELPTVDQQLDQQLDQRLSQHSDQIGAPIPWKEGGVYLITGGMGGLGLIFAQDIARRVQNPTLILVGRSPLTPQKQVQLQLESQRLGARLDYRQVDVSHAQDVNTLIQGILHDYTKLDGILHGAGVIRDSFIIKKTATQLQQVLAPKVHGTVYLDQASKDLNLDFFVLFSSGAAVVGNVGQADYAMANAFMDAYANYRHTLVESHQRFGRSLSINWPLWQEGGMQVDEQTLRALEQNAGIRALQTENGVNALLDALSLTPNQIMVLEGDRSRLRQGLFATSSATSTTSATSSTTSKKSLHDASSHFEVDTQRLRAKTLHQCKRLLGNIIKLSADRIDADEPLEHYGIDSVIVTRINLRLEAIFGEVSKTLLYEHQTLAELADFLATAYQKECMEWTGLVVNAVDATSAVNTNPAASAINATADAAIDLEATIALDAQPALDTKAVRKVHSLAAFDGNGLASNSTTHEPIAIIGLSGRYAQADTPQAYWENLRSGKDCVTEIPPERWPLADFYHQNPEEAIAQGKSYCKWGSFIDGFANFDPLFFSISPREAMGMDPQERLMLQTAWEVLEDAGYTRETLRERFQQRVGVFVGITKTGFGLYGPELWKRGEVVYPQTSFSSVANRISYLFNLRGPSLPIDTMCSSSLTAIHEACEHIRRRECALAIAGGVNVYLHPSSYVQMCAARMLSQDGKCKSFGEGGNGFVPGEGVGAVLLKPLAQAIEDHDHIYAVIRGSSVNHGGKTNGYTVPNPKAQAALIHETLEKAGVDGRTLSYIEAHGTGTELGDPIEISGLTQAFQDHTTDQAFCALGSAKSNLGHLEAAAGIAGLTKLILQMQHEQIAPSLHAAQLNANINFAKTPFVLQQTLSKWERPIIETNGEAIEYPRRAGISSFGAGGSNAHLIIEEYRTEAEDDQIGGQLAEENLAARKETVGETRKRDRNPRLTEGAQIIVLSAKHDDRLHHAAQKLLDYLDSAQAANIPLRNIAYTLQLGREAMEERLGLIVHSQDALKQKLREFVAGETGIEDLYRGQVKDHKKALALFVNDDDLQEAIARWMQRGKFHKLVELWSQGLAVDWNLLYREPKPQWVSLPTYPFEQTKYWIDTLLKAQPNSLTRLDAQPNPAKESSILHAGLQPVVPPQDGEPIVTWKGFPVWQKKALPENESSQQINSEYAQHIVMLFEMEWLSERAIESQISDSTCIHLTTQAKTLAQRFQDISIQVFERIKTVLDKKNAGKTLIQILIPSSAETQLFSGLTGLLRTAHMENPTVWGQLIALEPDEPWGGLIDKIQRNSCCPEDTFIRYQQAVRQTMSWHELSVDQTVPVPWLEGGVYLITGGLGGLGFIFAKRIAQETTAVSLVLTGRSALDKRRCEQIKELESLGAKVKYCQVDVSQKQETEQLIETIETSIGVLKGILHSAGLIQDNFIIKKTADEFRAVLAPKVDGLINLDQATQGLNLDFFVLFSSIAGSYGNLGQSDYACANAFMDAYAHYRNDRVAARECIGQTLSINWPLWQEGGMKIDAWSERAMFNDSGLVAMETEDGIQALLQGLASGQSQVMVLTGDRSRLQTTQTTDPSPQLSQPEIDQDNRDDNGISTNELEIRSVTYFKNLISSVLEIPAHRIQSDELLEVYGINSIVIMQLTHQLEKDFGPLSKTLFFEYPTIGEISQHFVTSHPVKLKEVLGLEPSKTLNHHASTLAVQTGPGISPVDLQSRPMVSRQKPDVSREEPKANQPSCLPTSTPMVAPVSSTTAQDGVKTKDIAIIGVSGRYPLSPDLETFWENLSQGKSCITEIPESRWDYSQYFDPEASTYGKAHSKWGGFLADVDKFDALFFNISPKEAQLMNPNERLFLEIVWELLERSGYTLEGIQERHQNKVGVYVGATHQQYQDLASDPITESILSMSSYSAIANRVSYFFDFHGPSMAIDTMCSSSLMAIKMACDSLLQGECQIAIAGGVNLSLHPNKYIGLSMGQIIGQQSTSNSFGKGNGYVPAEGVGAVLLKPLANAIDHGDSILAVIKSISTNHGGHTHGYFVPNPKAQAQLFEDNFRKSGIDPRTISYVESAANGSPLGDPIEVSALTRAFQTFTKDQGFCAIGSVKSNIGHAEAASGISQLTKVILQLQHQQLVPSINAEDLNPNLSFEDSPFYLQQNLQPWQRPVINIDGQDQECPRRATVSSFGAGGANAHLIIEEYRPASASLNKPAVLSKLDGLPERHMMVFSAKSRDRLQTVLQQMSHFVQSNQHLSLENMAYTLQIGRTAMTHRTAMLVGNRAELLQGIRETLDCLEQDTVLDTSIPVYVGNQAADQSELKHLLSGKSGKAMVKVLLAENDLEKIALYWVNGGNIPWPLLHKKGQASIMALPTYPFAKRRCWVETNVSANTASQDQPDAHSEKLSSSADVQRPSGQTVEAALVDIMLMILGLTAEELNLSTPLVQYGVDSITFTQIFQQIRSTINARIQLGQLLECQTTQDMLLYLQSQSDVGQIEPGQAHQHVGVSPLPDDRRFPKVDDKRFPELIQLNSSTKGRPVFWFHGIAGVMVYEPVAAKSQRPFYGIQPWNWISETERPAHIQTMVKRYIDAIRSVQPEGPYDFGGYSLGGALAYEAARQLQAQEERVATIVMVDTILANSSAQNKYSRKTDYLVTLNRILALSTWQRAEKMGQKTLIRADELNTKLSDEDYLKQLITLARERGLVKTETEIRADLEYVEDLETFYQTDPFTVMPLPDPNSVSCYYFRNQNGSLLGNLAPYYFATLQDEQKFATEQSATSQQWEKNLPNLQIIDIDSSNHMTMFSEGKPRQMITDFCETLYSKNGGPT